MTRRREHDRLCYGFHVRQHGNTASTVGARKDRATVIMKKLTVVRDSRAKAVSLLTYCCKQRNARCAFSSGNNVSLRCGQCKAEVIISVTAGPPSFVSEQCKKDYWKAHRVINELRQLDGRLDLECEHCACGGDFSDSEDDDTDGKLNDGLDPKQGDEDDQDNIDGDQAEAQNDDQADENDATTGGRGTREDHLSPDDLIPDVLPQSSTLDEDLTSEKKHSSTPESIWEMRSDDFDDDPSLEEQILAYYAEGEEEAAESSDQTVDGPGKPDEDEDGKHTKITHLMGFALGDKGQGICEEYEAVGKSGEDEDEDEEDEAEEVEDDMEDGLWEEDEQEGEENGVEDGLWEDDE